MDQIGLEIEVKRRQSELGADVYRKLPLGAAAPVYRLQSGESDTGLQSVFITAVPCVCVCVLLLQDLLQSCACGGRRRVEDMCYERRRAEACVDESAHHALVNAGGREIV